MTRSYSTAIAVILLISTLSAYGAADLAELEKAQAILGRGKSFYSNQKFEDAISEFDRYMECMRPLAASGEGREIYISNLHDISQIYFGIKRPHEIRKVLKEILDLSPQDQTAIYNIGIYYYLYEHNRSQAFKNFQKAIVIDRASPTAAKSRYAIEFIRVNPDSRMVPDFSFIDKEYRD